MKLPRIRQLTFLFAGWLSAAVSAQADDLSGFVTDNERAASASYVAGAWKGTADALPFSFSYDGVSSREILSGWKLTRKTSALDAKRTRIAVQLTDPKTGLEVRAEAVEYKDFPAVEWTLYFKNGGSADTPILADISAVDLQLSRQPPDEFVLHHNKGARATGSDFEPYATALGASQRTYMRTIGGRPSNGTMPYFNIAWPRPDRGVILAIGWPGQWQASFERDTGTALHVKAGQEAMHFKLHPGEEVRSPLVAVVWYFGDWIRGQNVWRRWMVQHNVPRQRGKLAPTQLVACSSHQFAEMIKANEENQKFFVDRYLEEKLPLSHWWMDAGWYKNDGTWINTGTWEVDPQRFPRGLRAITDHAHNKGLKSIVWFEPERVTQKSWIFENHPDWVLAPPPNPGGELYDASWRLLNLGDDEARNWLIEHVDGLLNSQGIDVYRQDFNLDPLHFWRANDASDRQGISELKYCAGYLAYWDALLGRHPDLRIDSCASGGRRNDLETLRRAVPFVRSDHLFEPRGQQSHNYGFSLWVPYHGTGTHVGQSAIGQHSTAAVDAYAFRSHMSCTVTACWDMRDKELDYETLRTLSGQLMETAPNFLGDFYPLTPYVTERAGDVWMAWQWDRPEAGKGAIQAFRRSEDLDVQKRFRLRGLDPKGIYRIDNVDSDADIVRSGEELRRDGLVIRLPQPRSAALILYSKVQ